ncbi:MAG TPA: hypothetical protein VH228_07230 [Nocardioides sp.]|jgi:hypothetical protein|nr:hypothetical protein [Nocardioides sp.]
MRTVLAFARRPATAVAALVLASGVTATTTMTPAAAGRPVAATAHSSVVTVHRGGPDATIRFRRADAGEAFLDVTVSARGVSWADRKNESAVVSAYVDGHYATDIVVMSSAPVDRQFSLGTLRAGRHTLRLHYAADRSRSRDGVAKLQDIGFRTVRSTSRAYAVARYAPVLYGRNIASLGGRFENNRTDTPLVGWHQVLPAGTPGHRLIEYSVMWSNEDGGTNTPALMAQWGRTTDIEWVYRVEVNAQGRRVAGSGVFQAAGHATSPFRGKYDGTHPLIQTCTSNNNVCDKVHDPMRFALSMRGALPADQTREHEMDIRPWTYQVMAREMLREHKIESPSDPASLAVGDQRSYLYVAVTHDTDPTASAGGMGLAVDVRLKHDPTTYSSNHGIALWTMNRNGPAATTVELPLGTNAADVARIVVRRVPIGVDNGASLTVTDLDRAFFLNDSYRPRPSFAQWHGSVTLTAGAPTAVVWKPGDGFAGSAG